LIPHSNVPGFVFCIFLAVVAVAVAVVVAVAVAVVVRKAGGKKLVVHHRSCPCPQATQNIAAITMSSKNNNFDPAFKRTFLFTSGSHTTDTEWGVDGSCVTH
jgi:hypothetical protein